MLIFISLLLLFWVVLKFNAKNGYTNSVLETILIFSVILVFVTEGLSLLKCLNLTAVLLTWSGISMLLMFFLVKDRKGSFNVFKNLKSRLSSYHKALRIYEKLLLWFTLVGLLVLLFQGIIYPPNNWDCLTYHMSRIMFWLGNGSVEHFPTHILRHLYQPPFSEYFILHINLINGNDYLSDSVQWLFLVMSVFALWGVLDFFQVSGFHKLLAAFLLITIPSVELQSSSAKNDIVCGFFVIAVLYYCLKSYYQTTLRNFMFLGISIGLGMLTKGTAYLFLVPILVLFIGFMLYKLIKDKNFKIILYGCYIAIIVLALNIGHFSRNYKINHDILNVDEIEAKAYYNSNMDGKLFFSSLLKNIGLHVGYPIQKDYDVWIREYHQKNGISINDPNSNYLDTIYAGPKKYETHEGYIPNSIPLYLILLISLPILILGVLKPSKYSRELLLLCIVFSQFILFVLILKWQPWHTRLHIPIFMLSVALVIVGIKRIRLLTAVVVVFIPSLVYSFGFNFCYNNLRPIVTNHKYTQSIKIGDSRFKKYFANQPQLYKEYISVLNSLYSDEPKKVGLMLTDWEYPLFSSYYYDKIELVAINVYNLTNQIPEDSENIDIIISNAAKTDYIIFNNKKYMNKTPENSYIWYYK